MHSRQIIRLIGKVSHGIRLLLFFFVMTSCNEMPNPVRHEPDNEKEGYYLTVKDGTEIYVWELAPTSENRRTVFIISGITGINHNRDKEVIDLLSSDETRVVVIHPRGTGYSEGARGDTDPHAIIADYCEIIKGDRSYSADNEKILLFGHSMSCALALKVATQLPGLDGLMLVNPPVKLKPAKGMSPGFTDILKYVGYFVFAPHAPVVNMAGDPSLIVDESDRIEAEQRNNDPLLVKYFSMRCMLDSKKIMDAMVKNARNAELPLLLLYGENDNIVDQSGCEEIFTAWKGKDKNYEIIKGGSHGKSTVAGGKEIMAKWIESLSTEEK